MLMSKIIKSAAKVRLIVDEYYAKWDWNEMEIPQIAERSEATSFFPPKSFSAYIWQNL